MSHSVLLLGDNLPKDVQSCYSCSIRIACACVSWVGWQSTNLSFPSQHIREAESRPGLTIVLNTLHKRAAARLEPFCAVIFPLLHNMHSSCFLIFPQKRKKKAFAKRSYCFLIKAETTTILEENWAIIAQLIHFTEWGGAIWANWPYLNQSHSIFLQPGFLYISVPTPAFCY